MFTRGVLLSSIFLWRIINDDILSLFWNQKIMNTYIPLAVSKLYYKITYEQRAVASFYKTLRLEIEDIIGQYFGYIAYQ